jgi:hypothetical protein
MKPIVITDPKTGKALKIYKISEYPLTKGQKSKSAGAEYVFVTKYKHSLALWETRIVKNIRCKAKIIGGTTFEKTIWGVWWD